MLSFGRVIEWVIRHPPSSLIYTPSITSLTELQHDILLSKHERKMFVSDSDESLSFLLLRPPSLSSVAIKTMLSLICLFPFNSKFQFNGFLWWVLSDNRASIWRATSSEGVSFRSGNRLSQNVRSSLSMFATKPSLENTTSSKAMYACFWLWSCPNKRRPFSTSFILDRKTEVMMANRIRGPCIKICEMDNNILGPRASANIQWFECAERIATGCQISCYLMPVIRLKETNIVVGARWIDECMWHGAKGNPERAEQIRCNLGLNAL